MTWLRPYYNYIYLERSTGSLFFILQLDTVPADPLCGNLLTHTHTHTHTQKERVRERHTHTVMLWQILLNTSDNCVWFIFLRKSINGGEWYNFIRFIHSDEVSIRRGFGRDIVWEDAASEAMWHFLELVYFVCNLTVKSQRPVIGKC